MDWRWGIVGPGAIAGTFAKAMATVDGGMVTAVSSRSQARADAFADGAGIANRYADVRDLVTDPEVDVVYVATPHSSHEHDTLLALHAGKHVMCEKPLALDAVQARRMVGVARDAGVFLMEAMWSRFLPAYRHLVDLVAAGRIGEPQLVEADLGFRSPLMPEHRLFNRDLGGGALLDLGIYPVQLCSLILGRPDLVVAAAHVGSTDVDEQVAAILHHPGGQLGVVKAATRTSMACTARITGTDGWIELPAPMHCPHMLTVTAGGDTERVEVRYPDGEGFRFQIEEVHRCLDAGAGESQVMSLDESLSIMDTLDAVRAQIGVSYPITHA